MTDNAYSTPQANLENDDEKIVILRRLIKEQSIIGVVVGTFLGLVPSLALMMLIATQGYIPIITWLIPGIAAGLFVKFCGRPFDSSLRIIPGAVTLLLIATIFFAMGVNPFYYLLAIVNGLIASAISRRTLTLDEERVLYAYKYGKISLN